MRARSLLVVFAAAVALAACGDNTSQKNNDNNGGSDTGISDMGIEDGGGGGDDTGGGGDDTGGGGDDTGGTDDMGGGDDTGGGVDMGTDTGGADMGTDASGTVCGNGMVEAGEECDDGNAVDDDECDSDCMLTCGNGVVNGDELCDTAIADGMPGACPTACDDGMACTTDTLQGTECMAECVTGDITMCTDDDGCCPSTCDETLDNDCTPMCGNDVVETGEDCDGNCPMDATDCDDGMACTADSVMGDASTCDAVCVNADITMCIDDDGCCPSTCDATDDNDCSATCGNGSVEPPETCDGNCPSLADCDDNDMCTTDTLDGDAGQCTAQCVNTPKACDDTATDGCCPMGCNANTDADCTAVCGNGAVEAGEECDDSGTDPGDGCDANCQIEPVAFRLSDLDLRDPHIYADTFLGCTDATSGLLGNGVNDQIEAAITGDSDGDGLLDLSFLLIFDPLDQTDGGTGDISVAEADCTEPMSSTMCTVDTTVHTVESSTYTSDTMANCLDVIAGTTRPYSTPVTPASPDCFSSMSVTLTFDIGGITIPLTDVQVGATYSGVPATQLTNGLLRGFISETTANNIVIPDSIAVVGGQTLAQLLPGGDPPDSNTMCNSDGDCTEPGETCVNVMGGRCRTEPNCAGHDDRDMYNGESGWWFYFNFPADQVPYTMQ